MKFWRFSSVHEKKYFKEERVDKTSPKHFSTFRLFIPTVCQIWMYWLMTAETQLRFSGVGFRPYIWKYLIHNRAYIIRYFA